MARKLRELSATTVVSMKQSKYQQLCLTIPWIVITSAKRVLDLHQHQMQVIYFMTCKMLKSTRLTLKSGNQSISLSRTSSSTRCSVRSKFCINVSNQSQKSVSFWKILKDMWNKSALDSKLNVLLVV